MGTRYNEIPEKLIRFIKSQKMFFVATASADSRVNLSPKGMDSLRVIHKNRVIWLNVTGSGNESAAHVAENPRMTIMFAAFDGPPRILRLYGKARVIHQYDAEWTTLYSKFEPLPGARQIFDLDIDLVQNSCGKAVPMMDYVEDRDLLRNWAEDKGESGVKAYWQEKNQVTIDGKPTRIIED